LRASGALVARSARASWFYQHVQDYISRELIENIAS
jgi:hypothetical protein